MLQPMTPSKRLKLLFLATRPAFLSITAIAFLIGMTDEFRNDRLLISITGLFLALMGHAAANVINDYFDSVNGTDDINQSRIFPFTGGSRFIQNKIFTPLEIKVLGIFLFCLTSLAGIWIAYLTTWNLLWVGLIGLGLGWSYSAPPLKLMSRGLLGEIAIVICWAFICVGAAFLSKSQINLSLIPVSIAYGLMVSTILFVNQIPDKEADRLCNKFTLAVQFTDQTLWRVYAAISGLAYVILTISVLFKLIPVIYLITLIPLPLTIHVIIRLKKNLDTSLESNIKQTILITHLIGLLIVFASLFK